MSKDYQKMNAIEIVHECYKYMAKPLGLTDSHSMYNGHDIRSELVYRADPTWQNPVTWEPMFNAKDAEDIEQHVLNLGLFTEYCIELTLIAGQEFSYPNINWMKCIAFLNIMDKHRPDLSELIPTSEIIKASETDGLNYDELLEKASAHFQNNKITRKVSEEDINEWIDNEIKMDN